MRVRAPTRCSLDRRLTTATAIALALLTIAIGERAAAAVIDGAPAAHAAAHRLTCRIVWERRSRHPLWTHRARVKAAKCDVARQRALLRKLARTHAAPPEPPAPVPQDTTAPTVTDDPSTVTVLPPAPEPVQSPAPVRHPPVTTPTPPPVTTPTPPPVTTPTPPPVTTPTPPPVTTPTPPPVTTPTPPPVTTPTPPPPTEPPPGPPDTTNGYNGFGIGAWPGGSWRPYASSSPFNQLIPSNVAVHPNSAQIVQRVLGWSLPSNMLAGVSGTSSDFGHPTYWAQPSDPLYTLHATQTQNAIEGMQIRVPATAAAAGGSDGHMTVVEPDGWEYDLWQVHSKPVVGGTLSFSIGGRTRIDGSGLGSSATASNFGNLAGMIRAQELAAGHINHALFIVVRCTATSTGFGYGTTLADDGAAYVYPASHSGARCGSSDAATAPPMGARFQLNMTDAQIAALAVPSWKKTILTALAHYGGYVGDTGGDGFGLMFESSTMYTSLGAADPLVDFARQSGIAPWNGVYAFNIADGVDWTQRLRVVVPPGS